MSTSDNIEPRSGSYLLVLTSGKAGTVDIGRIGSMPVLKGYYFYVGSAFGPGGVKARLNRHIGTQKPLRWHIDYLRQHCRLCSAYISYNKIRQESDWVESFLKSSDFQTPLAGFGASDSPHPSHLFYARSLPSDDRIAGLLATENLIKLM